MSEEKWHRLPADEIGLLIGKDANATVFSILSNGVNPDRPDQAVSALRADIPCQ
jgi:hypothetical protein